jgi:hypothetical protein
MTRYPTMKKYYPALVAALCLSVLVLLGLRWEVCEVDLGAAAHAATVPAGPWELPEDPPETAYPMPTIIDAPCVETASGIWAEVYFPYKSAAELSYVHVMAKSAAELSHPPTGGYWHERVGQVLFAYEWVAAECLPHHEKITFVLSEDLDIGD